MNAVIFDLDGTLLDSLEDIANAANETLEHMGFPTHPIDAYRYFVGDGVRNLMQRALPKDCQEGERLESCVTEMRRIYGNCWNVHSKPYPGIKEMLNGLQHQGVLINILSNKPDELTQKISAHIFAGWKFSFVRGAKQDIPLKPDPAAALECAKLLKTAPQEILFVGDTAIDMKTALNANMLAVGVTWGFRPREELTSHGATHIIDNPQELISLASKL